MTNTERAAQDHTLSDDDHVKFIGDDTWHSVRELRAHGSTAQGDKMKTYKYELVTAQGASCCKSDKIENLCAHCKAAAAAAEQRYAPPNPYKAVLRAAERLPTDGTAPDPYAAGLKALREGR